MIRANLSRSTKHIILGGKAYCAYCGMKIEPDVEIDHHEETSYYHCNCADALKEIEIDKKVAEKEREIRALRETYPKAKYTVTKRAIEELKIHYVDFETAKLLKEKGFDFCCEFQYVNCSSGYPFLTNIRDGAAGHYYKNSEIGQDEYAAPTLQMATKWLRERHQIFIGIQRCKFKFFFTIESMNEPSENEYSLGHFKEFERKTYEEACEAAIKYCLEKLI